MTSRTPLGTAMKRMPTTAKVTASRRRLKTTKRSARGPCIAGRRYWLAGQGAGAAGPVADLVPPSLQLRRDGPPNRRHPPRGTVSADDLHCAVMIEREQVLHVAKLARLRLSDQEVERMVGELSGILEHVDRIGKLDLEGVEPTSHVVELENVLRADEPRPRLPPGAALASAPNPLDGAFRVPSPQADA